MSFTEEEKQELLEKNFKVAEDGWSAQKGNFKVEKGCQVFWTYLYDEDGEITDFGKQFKSLDSSMLREF